MFFSFQRGGDELSPSLVRKRVCHCIPLFKKEPSPPACSVTLSAPGMVGLLTFHTTPPRACFPSPGIGICCSAPFNLDWSGGSFSALKDHQTPKCIEKDYSQLKTLKCLRRTLSTHGEEKIYTRKSKFF